MEHSHVPVVMLQVDVAATLCWEVVSTCQAIADSSSAQQFPGECEGLDALLEECAGSASAERRLQLGGMVLDLLRPAMPTPVRDLIVGATAGRLVVVLVAAGSEVAGGRRMKFLAALRHAKPLRLSEAAAQAVSEAVERLCELNRVEHHNHVVSTHLEYLHGASEGRSKDLLNRLLRGVSQMNPNGAAKQLAARLAKHARLT